MTSLVFSVTLFKVPEKDFIAFTYCVFCHVHALRAFKKMHETSLPNPSEV